MEANTIIIKKFKELKSLYPFALSLKKISGRYYVYKESGIWEKELKRHKTISEYLGRIDESGRYIKKRRSAKIDLETAKALIEENGGEVIWHTNRPNLESYQAGESKPYLKETDLKILTALSMNARIPASRLAEICGINKKSLYSKKKSLKTKLNIQNILEINIAKFGFTTYIILVKFENETPKSEDLRNILKEDPKIQLAFFTTGEYDLIVYLLDKDSVSAEDDLWKIMSNKIIQNYKARWYLIPFGQINSVVPIRNEFINFIFDSGKKDTIQTKATSTTKVLSRREFVVIQELNKDSTNDFLHIDKKYNLTNGTTRYTYYTLKQRGIVIRPTINITGLKIKYIGIVIIETTNPKEVIETRDNLLIEELEYVDYANKYALIGNISIPEGIMLFAPVYTDGDLEKIAENLKAKLNGVKIKTSIVTNIILGTLCFRRFDVGYTRQYSYLKSVKKIAEKTKINYE